MIKLRYGNTNTFIIPGSAGSLLVDTDMAGTMNGFYRAIKSAGVRVEDIPYVLATHYHPDHMGLIPELMEQGVILLLMDCQKNAVHGSDHIFARDASLRFRPIDESLATVISCNESRVFLESIGISGEIISTPSHSADSVSLLLDNGDCFVGDLEPLEYLAAYESNDALKRDWDALRQHHPKMIYYSHVNEKQIEK